MTNKKTDAKKPAASSAAKTTKANQTATPDIFSLSSEPLKPAAKTAAKVAPKTEVKTEKKVEVKAEKKAEVKQEKKTKKPATKTVKPSPKKATPKKEEKVAKPKAAPKKSEVVTKAKQATEKAKEKVTKEVATLFGIAADLFEEVNKNFWSFSQEVGEKRYQQLSEAFDKVEKTIEESQSLLDENSKNKDAIASSSEAIHEKSQELNSELLSFCEHVFNNHMENASMLFGCRSFEDLEDARRKMYQEDMEDLLERANKSADLWFGLLEDSYEPLQRRADEITERVIFRIL